MSDLSQDEFAAWSALRDKIEAEFVAVLEPLGKLPTKYVTTMFQRSSDIFTAAESLTVSLSINLARLRVAREKLNV